jgi:hypothetical protein
LGGVGAEGTNASANAGAGADKHATHTPLALVLRKDLKHTRGEDPIVFSVRVWIHLNDVVVSRRQVRRDVPLEVRAVQRDLQVQADVGAS